MPWEPGQSLYRMYIVRDGVKWYYCNTIGYRSRKHQFLDNPYRVCSSPFIEAIEGESRWLRLHGFKEALYIETFSTFPDPTEGSRCLDLIDVSRYLEIPVAIEDVSRKEVEEFYRAEGLLS